MRTLDKKNHDRRWRGDAMWRERCAVASHTLARAYPELGQAIAAKPFAEFELKSGSAAATNYRAMPLQAVAFVRDLPEAIRAAYLCSLLIWNMERFDANFARSGLDASFVPHFADGFHRIIDQIAENPRFANLADEAFLKDLWIARCVMIPAVAQVWWPRSGLSLRQLAGGGFTALLYVYLRCGGRRPFLEGHTHGPMVDQGFWTVDGWREALRLAARALDSFPECRGVFSAAWYFDPVAAEISPRVRFPAELQVGLGACRYRVGTSASTIAAATVKSPTRRRLHAEGAYMPTDYAVVWSRGDLQTAYSATRVS